MKWKGTEGMKRKGTEGIVTVSGRVWREHGLAGPGGTIEDVGDHQGTAGLHDLPQGHRDGLEDVVGGCCKGIEVGEFN